MLDIDYILNILPRLLRALGTTVIISVTALAIGTTLGVSLGALHVMSRPRGVFRTIVNAYVFVIRGTPAIVQIFALFFLLPRFGLQLPPFWVGVIALALNSTGYQVEIVRAAIASVDMGQREAAMSIGMTEGKAMRLIIVPQAARRMIPPLTNELSNLVKASSILSVIAVFELTKAGNAIIAANYRYVEVLTLQALLYFIVIQTLSWGTKYLETRVFSYGNQPQPRKSAVGRFFGTRKATS